MVLLRDAVSVFRAAVHSNVNADTVLCTRVFELMMVKLLKIKPPAYAETIIELMGTMSGLDFQLNSKILLTVSGACASAGNAGAFESLIGYQRQQRIVLAEDHNLVG